MKSRKILSKVPEQLLKEDLERYRLKAIELGATDAKIIPRESVLVDERVWAKCSFPPCPAYNICGQCPPNVMPFDRIRDMVNRYHYAIFMMMKVPSTHVTWEENKTGGERKLSLRDYAKYKDLPEYKKCMKFESDDSLKLDEIISKIESNAFYDGYHLALGFGAFTCLAWCGSCNLLSAGACNKPYAARPSVQAMALNVMQMAADVGWEMYPIGCSSSAQDVPHGTRLGIVLVY